MEGAKELWLFEMGGISSLRWLRYHTMVEICGNAIAAIDLEMGPYLVTLITFLLTVM
jgi:hypothetical protein